MPRKKTTIGRLEHIALPELGVQRVEAKIDTGAYRSALHYQRVRVVADEEGPMLEVSFHMGRRRVKRHFREFKLVEVKSSNGQVSERYLIRTAVVLNGRRVRTQFTLFDRSDMKFQVLLGRKFLRGRFVVDVDRVNVLG